MKHKLHLSVLVMLISMFAHFEVFGQVTYSYTGSMQTYVVPPGITSISVEMDGASGGRSMGLGYAHEPGLGGSISTVMDVVPGSTIYVFVGGLGGNGAVGAYPGAGGWNGGGTGGFGFSYYAGGGGGGATDVRIGGTSLADRVLVAGGGAGSAYNYGSGDDGGNGGGLIGEEGYSNFSHGSGPGDGGTQVSGGAAGSWAGYTSGTAGSFGNGGNGGPDGSGGGGGGGWYGGGGGAWSGGGGGSSYEDVSICSETVSLQGVHEGNGSVTITALCAGLELDIPEVTFCEGEMAVFSAESTTGGTVTWSGGIENDVPFAPPVGVTTYTATSDNPVDCIFEVEVLVNEYPTVVAGVSDATICLGDAVVFTGAGAETYEWDMGVEDGVAFTPGGIGTVTYTVTGYDEIGCDGTATVDVTVDPVPVVEASVSESEICEGETIILTVSGDADSYEWDPADIVAGVPYMPEDGVDTYTVTGSYDASGCSTTDVVTITLNPTPTVTAGAGDGIFCENELVVLAHGGDADIVSWSPTDFMPGTGTHTYTVSGYYEGFEGCPATATVDVTVMETPDVSANTEFEDVCLGQPVTLEGSGAMTYTWSPGDVMDGVPFIPATVGTYEYTVTGTDMNGCSSEDELTLTVHEPMEIDYTTVKTTGEDDGEIDVSITGGVAPFSYDWAFDGIGDYDDDEDLTGLGYGAYKLTVMGASGCTSTITILLGSQASIADEDGLGIKVFPNPTTDQITIQANGNFEYSIVDINGSILINGKENNNVQVSLANFADGVYFVSLIVNDQTKTLKLIKQ